MNKLLGLFSMLLFLVSCGGQKKTIVIDNDKVLNKKTTNVSGTKQERVVQHAKNFLGTPYLYGGLTKSGMDCSGLVYTSFQKIKVTLPRISSEMSKKGKSIKNKDIQPGDLVFFKTSKKPGRYINHVGVVSKVNKGNVYFIHSSTSKGVIESSLDSPYWNKAYKFAKRVL